jgi:cytochrome P450
MVCKALMQARATREVLKAWLDKRVQKIMDGKQPDEDSTFVHYWLKNGQLGENFRRIDIVFECFHNFLAFSQWANMVYNVAAKLEPVHGDPAVRVRFDQVMKDPDASDGGAFTPLDRFVMELFRVISPNGGSFSTMARNRAMLGTAFSGIMTPHLPASMSPLHWQNPTEFDPDRFKSAPTTVDNDEAKAHQVGLARCPFSKASFPVKDGRKVTMTNSAFGAVYSEINGKAVPLVDTAGYAPFGFGYRRCAGEQLTVEFIKEFLRHVWKEKVSFSKLDIPVASKQPVNPGTVLNDDIAFNKAK